MRLIDADALLERFVYADIETKLVDVAHDIIEAAPTIRRNARFVQGEAVSKADEEEGLTSIGLCCACVYWHCAVGEYREAQSGECRRHPPTVRQGRIITSYNVGPDCEEDVPLTAWPVTRGSDWCGEWRAEP